MSYGHHGATAPAEWPRHGPKLKTIHSIATAHYTPDNGPCDLTCACGAPLAAACPTDLDAAWRAHRRAAGCRWNISTHGSLDFEDFV